jgi:zinc transporter ZupT
MMTRVSPNTANRVDPPIDPVFVERERNRFAARALAFLVLLNGAAALVLLSILARAPESSVEPKFASAMLFFSGGAIAALLSSFLAYINRTVTMEAPERASLRRALQIIAILVVIGSAASFLTGMNMVGTAASEKSSSHPKGPRERAPVTKPSDKVQLLRSVHGAGPDRRPNVERDRGEAWLRAVRSSAG